MSCDHKDCMAPATWDVRDLKLLMGLDQLAEIHHSGDGSLHMCLEHGVDFAIAHTAMKMHEGLLPTWFLMCRSLLDETMWSKFCHPEEPTDAGLRAERPGCGCINAVGLTSSHFLLFFRRSAVAPVPGTGVVCDRQALGAASATEEHRQIAWPRWVDV